MAAGSALYVNDFDCLTLGVYVSQVDGWLDGFALKDKTMALYGRAGLSLISTLPDIQPRRVTVTGLCRRATQALVRAAILELKERLGRGLAEVRFIDDLQKVFLCRCESFVTVPNPPQFVSPYVKWTAALVGDDPAVYDRTPQVVGFSTTRQRVPLGSVPSAPLIRVIGAVTNPVVTYRDLRGISQQTMGFTIALGANDYLEIDCDAYTVTKYVAGVATVDITLLTSGDFLRLDPNDGDYPNGQWPTLEVSAGTGEAIYRRGWL